ncbi:MAG TPA: hypothetical protein DD490_11610, partial [Acidobacteria bacterium]|nr:hypothetical protein [Acidobacteriota bacterium]
AAALAVLLCLAAGLALPRIVERYLRLRIGVKLEEVRFPSTATAPESQGLLQNLLDRVAGLADLVTGNDQLSLRLRVRNDTPLEVSLVSTTYTITVDGTEAASGVWNPEEGKPVLFAPGAEVTADVAIPPTAEAALAISRALLAGRRPQVQVTGQLTVDALWTTFTLPFEVKDLQIDLLSPDPPSKPEAPAPAPESRDEGPRQVA